MRLLNCCLIALLGGLVLSAPRLVSGAEVVTSCQMRTSGDGCIFDLQATADGLLQVGTKASTEGARWRTTVAEVGKRLALSQVGDGSVTEFTGKVKRPVGNGTGYQIFVTYEGPLPGNFPTSVMLQFVGPVTVAGPRPKGGEATALSGRYAGRQVGGPIDSFALEISEDGSQVVRIVATGIGCGGFPYAFDEEVSPGIVISTQRFSLKDLPITAVRTTDGRTFDAILDIDGAFFDADAFGGTPEQALGGFSFVIGASRCHFRWVATAVAPDADKDGWHDSAEQRLGANAADSLSTPEHRDVPTTDFYGPDPCHDFADNDRDGNLDGADSGCTS